VVIRITYVLGALFFVAAFSMALINKSSTGNVQQIAIEQQTQQQTTASEWWKPDTQGQPAVPAPEGVPATPAAETPAKPSN
jgi:heat shock protein HslJ